MPQASNGHDATVTQSVANHRPVWQRVDRPLKLEEYKGYILLLSRNVNMIITPLTLHLLQLFNNTKFPHDLTLF
jgi:hypothetical protein